MKKTFLIISILSVIFLTSCGIFNLNGFIVPEPGKAEFMTIVEKLDTPQKISDYMLENFTYQKHLFYAPSPYQLWLTKNGDCNDFATFGVFVTHWHGLNETYQIKIYYCGTIIKHFIAIYIEDDGLSFTDCQYYNLCLPDGYRFNTFKEIVEYDGTLRTIGWPVWTKYIVYYYDGNIKEVGYNDNVY